MAVKPSLPSSKGQKYTGELSGLASEKFAKPYAVHNESIKGLSGTHNDIGEKSGFEDSGYIVKKGTPYGEAAKLNMLPPGMDISNQEVADIRNMPLKTLISASSYPGDGWEPTPRDLPE